MILARPDRSLTVRLIALLKIPRGPVQILDAGLGKETLTRYMPE
jgi:hypothetical protein